jgi:hypothetical protein
MEQNDVAIVSEGKSRKKSKTHHTDNQQDVQVVTTTKKPTTLTDSIGDSITITVGPSFINGVSISDNDEICVMTNHILMIFVSISILTRL